MELSKLNEIIENVIAKTKKWDEKKKRDFLLNIKDYTSNFAQEYRLPDYDVEYIRQQLKRRIQTIETA